MRLNVACGAKRVAGYVGVDAVQRGATDIIADARSIPLPDECAVEVMAIHFVEHLHKWEVPQALQEWHRLLMYDGLLVLELPDILKACRNVLEQFTRPGKPLEQMGLWALYGDPRECDPFMNHKWGWTFETLSPLVAEAGFREIVEHETQWHSAGKGVRDFRLEARKK